MIENEIPTGIIKSTYMTQIYLKIDNVNISTDAFKASLYKFNNDLENADIILKRVMIKGYEKQTIELSFITTAMKQINTQELKEAIKNFLKEYLNLPTVEVKSANFDYLNRIKSLQYFKEQYSLVEETEEDKVKDFKEIYKSKMNIK